MKTFTDNTVATRNLVEATMNSDPAQLRGGLEEEALSDTAMMDADDGAENDPGS